jgi:hypothetical protein
MRTLLKILEISVADVAKRAGVSRQAAWLSLKRGKGRAYKNARLMIGEARYDMKSLLRALEAREELKKFLEGTF